MIVEFALDKYIELINEIDIDFINIDTDELDLFGDDNTKKS